MKATSSAVLGLHLLGDVDDRSADAALAERGGGEEEDDGLLAENVGEVLGVHRRGRGAGVDVGDVADIVEGRRVDGGRGVALGGDAGLAPDGDGGLEVGGGDVALVVADDGSDAVLARVERGRRRRRRSRRRLRTALSAWYGDCTSRLSRAGRVGALDLAALLRPGSRWRRRRRRSGGRRRRRGRSRSAACRARRWRPTGTATISFVSPTSAMSSSIEPPAGLGEVGGGRRLGGRLARGGGLVVSAASGEDERERRDEAR